MANYSGVQYLASPGTTGNVTGSAVQVDPGFENVGFQFVVEAVGATPTVTYKVQGSLDNSNWSDISYITASSDTAASTTQTATGVGATTFFLNQNNENRFFQYFRIVTSANTNVTFRAELYTRTD